MFEKLSGHKLETVYGVKARFARVLHESGNNESRRGKNVMLKLACHPDTSFHPKVRCSSQIEDGRAL